MDVLWANWIGRKAYVLLWGHRSGIHLITVVSESVKTLLWKIELNNPWQWNTHYSFFFVVVLCLWATLRSMKSQQLLGTIVVQK